MLRRLLLYNKCAQTISAPILAEFHILRRLNQYLHYLPRWPILTHSICIQSARANFSTERFFYDPCPTHAFPPLSRHICPPAGSSVYRDTSPALYNLFFSLSLCKLVLYCISKLPQTLLWKTDYGRKFFIILVRKASLLKRQLGFALTHCLAMEQWPFWRLVVGLCSSKGRPRP